jgi:hypothetical protein
MVLKQLQPKTEVLIQVEGKEDQKLLFPNSQKSVAAKLRKFFALESQFFYTLAKTGTASNEKHKLKISMSDYKPTVEIENAEAK